MSLKSAVEEFFALIDHGRTDIEGQSVDTGGGYSQQQYDDALDQIRREAGIRGPHDAAYKERDSK